MFQRFGPLSGLAIATTTYANGDASVDTAAVCVGRYVPAREIDPAAVLPNADAETVEKLSKRTASEMTLLKEECFDSVEAVEQSSR